MGKCENQTWRIRSGWSSWNELIDTLVVVSDSFVIPISLGIMQLHCLSLKTYHSVFKGFVYLRNTLLICCITLCFPFIYLTAVPYKSLLHLNVCKQCIAYYFLLKKLFVSSEAAKGRQLSTVIFHMVRFSALLLPTPHNCRTWQEYTYPHHTQQSNAVENFPVSTIQPITRNQRPL